MKFIVLGTTEFAVRCAQALLDSGAEVSVISMPKDALPLNSADIQGFAKKRNIPFYEAEDINSPNSTALLRKHKPDYILSSWPMIIKKEVLEIPRMCIGTHPTELPHNRGRHPLHWLIALGFSGSKLSFFRMDEGIDTGKVLLQVPFSIGKNDHIKDVISKLNEAAYKGTKTLYEQLRISMPEGAAQEHAKANYWRKRTPHDTILDLRMPSATIMRIVRSFSQPYPCAKLIFENRAIKISNASIAQTSLSNEEVQQTEPGKIISAEGKHIKVKADDGIIDLESTAPLPENLAKAKYIHPPSKYLSKWPQAQLKCQNFPSV